MAQPCGFARLSVLSTVTGASANSACGRVRDPWQAAAELPAATSPVYDLPVLNELDEFVAVCAANSGAFSHLGGMGYNASHFEAGDMYCPGCGGPRRMVIHPRSPVRSAHSNMINLADSSTDAIAGQLAPGVFTLVCVQDKSRFTALLFEGPDGFELAIFPRRRGGLSTPRTPAGVAYYLDQAQRAQSGAANSAALAMYRAGLEHLLHEQGFRRKMLGPKIGELNDAIKAGKAPKWAMELDAAYLMVIGKLGNLSIHPTEEGDAANQAMIDVQLLTQVQITIAGLLELVYERDHREAERLAALEAAVKALSS
jgi:hypothetical protein